MEAVAGLCTSDCSRCDAPCGETAGAPEPRGLNQEVLLRKAPASNEAAMFHEGSSTGL